ncbi:hypothetical protein HG530_012869 [Fusarium avenaceum]|nr:hypothetical protein HG530_012869 [Fusarium avenaceum]
MAFRGFVVEFRLDLVDRGKLEDDGQQEAKCQGRANQQARQWHQGLVLGSSWRLSQSKSRNLVTESTGGHDGRQELVRRLGKNAGSVLGSVLLEECLGMALQSIEGCSGFTQFNLCETKLLGKSSKFILQPLVDRLRILGPLSVLFIIRVDTLDEGQVALVAAKSLDFFQ